MNVDAFQWIPFTASALGALAAKDLRQAERILNIQLDPYFIADDSVRRWTNRLRQVALDEHHLLWIAQVVAIRHQVIGHAGFHGPPDAEGMVEVAYSVLPQYRQKGYAKAMLAGLLKRAKAEPQVQVVRATIRPDNLASLATVRSATFTKVGEQWDEIDGLEWVFELGVK